MVTETTSTGRESDKFMLRLPDGMRDRLKESAKANNRTLNAEIVDRLARSYAASEMGLPGDALDNLGVLSLLVNMLLDERLSGKNRDEIEDLVRKSSTSVLTRLSAQDGPHVMGLNPDKDEVEKLVKEHPASKPRRK